MRVSVDIGGTFTDCVVVDDDDRVWTGKAPSTSDPVDGVLEALRHAAAAAGHSPDSLLSATNLFVHGTTIGTNAVLERKGGVIGLITTRGHEDSMIFGRLTLKSAGLSPQQMIHVSQLRRPDPIVPRQRILGVNERVDRDGDVLVALRDGEVRDAVRTLVEEHSIDCLAVAFLWSYVRPDHERRVAELVRDMYPDLFVTLSSDVAPVMGEYERTVSAVLNSYIGVPMKAYVERLEKELGALGFRGTPLVMEAGGGVAPAWYAVERPVVTLDSGPVGGVAGVRFVAEMAGERNAICTDVGGTSFEVALVSDGQAETSDTPVIGQYKYHLPKIAVESVGAGGGSIAWIDAAGILHVGPASAGSDPGPACYGRGGTSPTVTDANLVLGYLSGRNFISNGIELDRKSAVEALTALGDQLGSTAEEAAASVLEIANATMADLVRKQTVANGRDPRDYALFAYGGAGSLHAGHFGRDLGVKSVYFVHNAGVFSAQGMLASEISFIETKSALLRSPFTDEDASAIQRIFAELDELLRECYEAARIPPEHVKIRHLVRGRFVGQVNEFEMEFVDRPALADRLVPDFVAAYERSYGANTAYLGGGGVELINFRSHGAASTGELKLAAASTAGAASDSDGAILERRPVYCLYENAYRDTAVYDGALLGAGMVIAGPAVIERATDTVVIPAGSSAVCDPHLNVVMHGKQES